MDNKITNELKVIMEQTLNFELVSPEEKLVSEPVRLAVIPGEAGEMGVGANHASLVASLRPGVVALYKDSMNDKPRKIFIAGGFADVTGTNCTVLAEEAVDLDKLDKDTLEQKLKDLNEDMSMADEPADRIRIQSKINLTKAKLAAVTGSVIV